MSYWTEVWKNEKYPMWVENGGLASYWDKVAAERFYRLSKNKKSSEKQIEELNLKRTDIVLDIGCGTGRLTLPIAEKVKVVYGLDVSREMLKIVEREAMKAGLKNVKVVNANFETFDISKIEKADVSISYNSLGVYDIRKVLEKINSITKREVFIFTFASKGEWLDERLAKAIYGKRIKVMPASAEIIYNVLVEMGIEADLEVKRTVWESKYDGVHDAVEKLMEFYKFEGNLRCKVESFVKNNCRRSGVKCAIFQKRDIAKIHWRVQGGG